MAEPNSTLKAYARSKAVFLYEIASQLGISEFTFTRHLRKELPEEERQKIMRTIDMIAKTKWGE